MLLLFFRSVSPPPPPQLLLLLAMMYNVNRDAIYKNSSKIAIRFQSRWRSPPLFCSSFETKKTRPRRLFRQKKERSLRTSGWSKRVLVFVRTGKESVYIYMCRVEIILMSLFVPLSMMTDLGDRGAVSSVTLIGCPPLDKLTNIHN